MDKSDSLEALRQFIEERDWTQFHTPSNLAKSISIESAELLELFQWSDEADLNLVSDELADVLTYCLLLADKIGVNPDEIVLAKLEKTRDKYPIALARGKSDKYDRL